MPTHHDETLLERYQREHREFERICMSKTSELCERLADEADQCRNDGADDIAALLMKTTFELRRLAAEVVELRSERTAWRVTAENAEAAVKQAREDAQTQIDTLMDAALDWSGYVVEDTAPRTLTSHLEMAIESMKGTS